MDKDFLKGIKFSLGIISVFLFLGLVFAGTHYASQLLGGTFNGNYDFQTGSVIDFTNATVLGLDGIGSGGGGDTWKLMHIQDQKATGTDGGASVAGEQTRDLNTVVTNEITGAYLNSTSSEVVLPAGTYYIEAEAPYKRYQQQMASRLYIVNSTDDKLLVGSNVYSGDGIGTVQVSTQTLTRVSGIITLEEETVIKVVQYTQNAYSIGLGGAVSVAPYEVYTDLRIWKIEGGSGSSSLPSCSTDEIIQYNGSDWVCADGSGIGSGGGAGWTHDGTQVFSGTAPVSFTDLDLSSIVGTQKALVMLKFTNNDGTNWESYWVRTNGDTETVSFTSSANAGGTVTTSNLAGAIGYLIVETDENGIIEWNSAFGYSTDIELVGYISSTDAVAIGGETRKLMHVQDQKTAGTNGGSAIAGWQTRTLNTVLVNEITGASLSSNQITLPAGKYYIEGTSSSYGPLTGVRLRLYDVSNSVELIRGLGVRHHNEYSYGVGHDSQVSGTLTFADSTSISLQMYAEQSSATHGLGEAIASGTEVYSDIKIWKIEEGEGASTAVPYMPGYIYGLEYAQDSTDPDNDITISTGYARDEANTKNIDLTTEITKQLDATWAQGNNAGGLFSGSVTADTIYHICLIKNPTTGAVDAGFDTDEDCANRPSGYTSYRWIGFVRTDASSNIVNFNYNGEIMQLTDPIILGTSPSDGSTVRVNVSDYLPLNHFASYSIIWIKESTASYYYGMLRLDKDGVAGTRIDYHQMDNRYSLKGEFNSRYFWINTNIARTYYLTAVKLKR